MSEEDGWAQPAAEDSWTGGLGWGGGCSVRLIERPGLALGAEELASLVYELHGLADRCLPAGPLRDGVLSGDTKHLANTLLAAAYGGDRGDMAAFSAMVVLDVTVEDRPALLNARFRRSRTRVLPVLGAERRHRLSLRRRRL